MFTHLELPQREAAKQKVIKGKRFYETPEGNFYPSITTVLGHGEKPWLENWRNMLGHDAAAKESQRCAERGKAVHSMIEKYLNNDPKPTQDQPVEYTKRFNQLKFRLNKINNIRGLELSMYSDELEVAGTADCVADYEGELSIIDFKTSTNNRTEEMVADYYLQCTAYAKMFTEMYKTPVKNIVILVTVERGLVPLMFKQSIDSYLDPLVQRINTFYNEVKI